MASHPVPVEDPSSTPEQPIQVDPEGDNESALGDEQSTYTESLGSTLLEPVLENNRGYHKFRDGHYILPEDSEEQDRLDLQHEMFRRTFNNKLILAPIPEQVHEVLDLGTGTGIWAIEFADFHPESSVTGIDLSPIQPGFVPPNCKFEVDDFEEPWNFQQKFDLIHGRMLLTSIAEPQRLFKRAYDALKPGGWLEMQDLVMPLRADDDSIPEDSAYRRWNDLYTEACRDRMKRDPSWAERYKEWMEEAGFENVAELRYKWPQNPWPKNRDLKVLGQWNMINMLNGLEGFTLRVFMKILEMSREETEVLMMEMRKDVQDRRIHAYWPM